MTPDPAGTPYRLPKYHRHPAEVTADRLGDAFVRWQFKFSQQERDYISLIRHALQQIADGER